MLDTLALFLGPAALQDIVPGLRYLHTVRLHRSHPHIGSLAVAPHLEANGQPPDNWMLAAWLHATETHFTPPVLPKDPRNFMFVTAFEQQRAATAEWGFHTLWQTVQRLTSDWRRAFWVTGRLRTLTLMMGGHLRLGQESPLQTLDSHILARFASDAFFFNIADLDGEDRHQGLLFSFCSGHGGVAEVVLPSATGAEAAELSGAASTVEEREKLAQAHVTGSHNCVAEVALPSVTTAGVAELSGAASTVEEREKLAQKRHRHTQQGRRGGLALRDRSRSCRVEWRRFDS